MQLQAAKEDAQFSSEKLKTANFDSADQVKQLKVKIRELEEELSATRSFDRKCPSYLKLTFPVFNNLQWFQYIFERAVRSRCENVKVK